MSTSEESRNCFIIFSTVAKDIWNNPLSGGKNNLTTHIFLYPIGLCLQPQKNIYHSDNHFHVYLKWQANTKTFFFSSNILAISSSLHRVILNLFSGVSYASEMTIVDVLQTSLPSYLPCKEKWNVWKVAIRLLPMIVNFCKNSLFAF
jgi:hypothetical protein